MLFAIKTITSSTKYTAVNGIVIILQKPVGFYRLSWN